MWGGAQARTPGTPRLCLLLTLRSTQRSRPGRTGLGLRMGGARRRPRSSFVGRSLISAALGAEEVGEFEVRGWYMDANHSVEVEGGLFHHAWA